jgi:hypothetical protein
LISFLVKANGERVRLESGVLPLFKPGEKIISLPDRPCSSCGAATYEFT